MFLGPILLVLLFLVFWAGPELYRSVGNWFVDKMNEWDRKRQK